MTGDRSPIDAKWLVAICCLLIAISLWLQASHLAKICFTTWDDVGMDLWAQSVKAHGLGEYWKYASGLAKQQGRIYFESSLVFFLLPFFTDSLVLRAVVITLLQFLALASLAAFLGWYISRVGALVFLAVLYCLRPVWQELYPVNALPIYYHLPVLFFFAGMSLYVAARRGHTGKNACATALLFASLFFYEALMVPFFVIGVITALAEERRATGRFPTRPLALLRTIRVFPLVFGAWTLIYLGFRHLHPSIYEGSAWAAKFSLKVFLGDMAAFLFASLPGSNLVAQWDLVQHYSTGQLGTLGAIHFSIDNLTALGFLQACGAFVAILLHGCGTGISACMKKANTGRNACAAIAIFLGISIPLPLALTAKYQGVAHLWAPYLTGYFSFLAFAVAAALLCEGLFESLQRRPFGRLAAAALIGAICFFFTGVNSIANEAIQRKQEAFSAKWRVMNGFLKTRTFRQLPGDSVLYAPSLWHEQIESQADDYWTKYVFAHSGREIPVLRDEAKAVQLAARRPVYYCEAMRAPGAVDAALLVSRMSAGEAGQLVSDAAAIVAEKDFKAGELAFIHARKGMAGFDPLGPREFVEIPPFRYEDGVFVTTFESPGMVVGSGALVDLGAGLRHRPVEVIFGRGFSGLEKSEKKYWHWSDGPSGEAFLELRNNSGATLPVRFRAIVGTASPTKNRFDLTIAGKSESVMLGSGDVLDRVVNLRPGGNELRFKSFGPRVVAPNEPRYLVFSLEGWEVLPYDARCVAEAK